MVKDLKVTLYDIFGYLLPGVVVVTAIGVLAWALFFPQVPLGALDLNGDMSLVLVLVSYFGGHVAQAFSNVVAWLLSRQPEEEILTRRMPPELIDLARWHAGKMLGINLKYLDAAWLVMVCDEALVACGLPGEREVFQYREGFYRGLAVALGLLMLAVGTRAIIPGSAIRLEGTIYSMPLAAWAILCILLALCTWLIWRRFERFRRYRIQHSIIGYLVTRAGIVSLQQVQTDGATPASSGEEG